MPFVYDTLKEEYYRLCAKKESILVTIGLYNNI